MIGLFGRGMDTQQEIWNNMGWNRTKVLWDRTLNAKMAPGAAPIDVRIPDFSIFLQPNIPYFVAEVAATQELDDAIKRTKTAIRTHSTCQGGMVINMVEKREGLVYPTEVSTSDLPSGQELEEDMKRFSRKAGLWLEKCLKKVYKKGHDGVFKPFVYGGHCWVGSITVTCLLFRKVGNDIVQTSTVSISSGARTLSRSKQT
jgi:hypothetical protein